MLRLRRTLYLVVGCDDRVALQTLVMQGRNREVGLVNHINHINLRLGVNPNPLNFVTLKSPFPFLQRWVRLLKSRLDASTSGYVRAYATESGNGLIM
jgi:hypothetical protein